MAEDDLSDLEISELEEAARQTSIYHEDVRKFERNANLTNVVHATFHIVQFVFAVVILTFHLIHHFINCKAREVNPKISKVFELWNPVFYIVYPICMMISLVLAICRIFLNILDSKLELAIVSSIIGCSMMLTGGISAMRHTMLHVNLNIVSDHQLEIHPVFLHNIIICILSTFGALVYLIHSWIMYDCWCWRRKQQTLNHTLNAIEASSSNTISGKSLTVDVGVTVGKSDEREKNRIGELKNEYRTKEKEKPGQLNPIAMLESVPTRTPTHSTVIKNVTAYHFSFLILACFNILVCVRARN